MSSQNAFVNEYASIGVNYEKIDPFKKYCMELAIKTEENYCRTVFDPISETRGESAFGFNLSWLPGIRLYHVEETLGTKSLVADALEKLTGEIHYHSYVAEDAVAMIVNDLITQGARPVSLAMHLAVWSSKWFDDFERAKLLASGWYSGCLKSNAVWAGGETPALGGIINESTYLISGSGVGYTTDSISGNIKHGDSIVVFESSGIHANGLSLCRKIAEKLDKGYKTHIGDGLTTYGDSLIKPTIIYAELMDKIRQTGIKIHYAVNITGHGWKKFMRSPKSFEYVLTKLPTENPLFTFLCDHAGFKDISEAYETFNMGAGFAVYVDESDVDNIINIAKILHVKAFKAGHIVTSDKPRVRIEPLDIVYESLFYQ